MLCVSIPHFVNSWISLSVSYSERNSAMQTQTKVVRAGSRNCWLTCTQGIMVTAGVWRDLGPATHRLYRGEHLLQPPGQQVGVELARGAAEHARHVVDQRTQLVLQPQQLAQSLLHHGGEWEEAEGVAGWGGVENHHVKVHSFHQFHHLERDKIDF